MSKASIGPNQSILNPTCQMAFAVAACAFASAGIGAIVNHWLTGWMAVGGMVGVGLFYLAIGILSLSAKDPLHADDERLNASQRSAKFENLIGEPVVRHRLKLVVPTETPSRPESKNTGNRQATAETSAQQRRE